MLGAAEGANKRKNHGTGGIDQRKRGQDYQSTAGVDSGLSPHDKNYGENQRAGTVVQKKLQHIRQTGPQHQLIDRFEQNTKYQKHVQHLQRRDPLMAGFGNYTAAGIQQQGDNSKVYTGDGQNFAQPCECFHGRITPLRNFST